MDMFKSEKEKELLIISLSAWMTGSPCRFASHSVVYAVQIWSLVWPRICFSLLAFGGGGKKVGVLGAGVPTGSQETSSFCMLPLASVPPRKTVLEKLWMDGQFLCQGIYVWTRTCQVFHPSAQAHWLVWLPMQLNPDLPLGEPTTAEFLCEANHIIPLGNKRCILRGTYAGPGLVLWHAIRSQTWFLLGQGGLTRSRWKSQIIHIPHVAIPVILSLLTFAGETRLFLDSKAGLQTHSHVTEKEGKCAAFSVGTWQTPRHSQRNTEGPTWTQFRSAI